MNHGIAAVLFKSYTPRLHSAGIHCENPSEDLQVLRSQLKANDQLKPLFPQPAPNDSPIGILVTAGLEIAHENIRIRNYGSSKFPADHSLSYLPAATKFLHNFFGLFHSELGPVRCASRPSKQFLIRHPLHVLAQ